MFSFTKCPVGGPNDALFPIKYQNVINLATHRLFDHRGEITMLSPAERTGFPNSLQWRHNQCYGVSNHQRIDCFSTVCSRTDQRKHQSSMSLAFVRGIHRWPLNSPHKGPVTRKMFPFDDVMLFRRAGRTVITDKLSSRQRRTYQSSPMCPPHSRPGPTPGGEAKSNATIIVKWLQGLHTTEPDTVIRFNNFSTHPGRYTYAIIHKKNNVNGG